MTSPAQTCWVDGALVAAPPPQAAPHEPLAEVGGACYTTARVSGGRAHLATYHVRRLRRDATRLGLADVDEDLVRRALAELGEAVFGAGEGIVRIEARRGEGGATRLVGVPRPLDSDPATWESIRAPFPHPGPTRYAGCKLSDFAPYTRARAAARAGGVQECLLFDGDDRLVEGSGSNLWVHAASGKLLTPALALGPVAGIAREVVLERVPEAREGEVRADALRTAREIVAVNAVRGARAIVRVDGAPVGPGRAGPWAERLARVLATD